MSNMVVRTNVFALNAHRNMKNVGVDQQRASSRLSSGYRINSAADDAAGLAISESMRAQIRGLDQASRNSQDGQALINTAEGGMQEIQNMVQRIRELTVQAANDTNTEDNRAEHIALEIRNLLLEIDDMANRVEFNGMVLLNGDFANTVVGSDLAGTMSTDLQEVLIALQATQTGVIAELGDADNLDDVALDQEALVALANELARRDMDVAFDASDVDALNGYWDYSDSDHRDMALAFLTERFGEEAREIFEMFMDEDGFDDGWDYTDFDLAALTSLITALGNVSERQLGNFGEGGLRFQVGANENQLMWTSIRDMRILSEDFGTRGSSETHGTAGQGIELDSGTIHHANEGSLGAAMAVFINNWYQAFNVADGETTDISGWDIENFPGGFDPTIATGAQALSAIVESIEAGIQFTSLARAELGAVSNRLEFTSRSLDISSENLSDAESRVRNADMAREMMAFTMANVLQQASVSMLAQANQLPNNLLQLLR